MKRVTCCFDPRQDQHPPEAFFFFLTGTTPGFDAAAGEADTGEIDDASPPPSAMDAAFRKSYLAISSFEITLPGFEGFRMVSIQ